MANKTKGSKIILLAIHPSDEIIETPLEGADLIDVIDLDGFNISKPTTAEDARPLVLENFLAALTDADEDFSAETL